MLVTLVTISYDFLTKLPDAVFWKAFKIDKHFLYFSFTAPILIKEGIIEWYIIIKKTRLNL